jgi:hypothetical protein
MSFQTLASSLDSPLPHLPDSIRAATLQLSKMPFSASLPTGGMSMRHLSVRTYGVSPAPIQSETTTTPLPLRPLQKTGAELNTQYDEDGGFIFPRAAHTGQEPATDSTSFLSSQSLNSSFLREIPDSSTESDAGFGLESSIETLPPIQKLSGLSLFRPGSSSTSLVPPSPSTSSSSSTPSVPTVLPLGLTLPSPLPIPTRNDVVDTTPTATPMGTPRPLNNTLPSLLQPQKNPSQSHVHWRSPRSIARLLGPTSPCTASQPHEQTPLLGGSRHFDDSLHSTANSTTEGHDLEIGLSGTSPTFLHKTVFGSGPFRLDINHVRAKMKHGVAVNVPQYLMQAVSAVPAVLLGSLLNILDGVSCGLFSSLLIFSVAFGPASFFNFGPSIPPFLFWISFLLFYPIDSYPLMGQTA